MEIKILNSILFKELMPWSFDAASSEPLTVTGQLENALKAPARCGATLHILPWLGFPLRQP